MTFGVPSSRVPSAVPVPLPTGEASVYTHSHLGWGRNGALAKLTEAEATACLPRGASSDWPPEVRSSEDPKIRVLRGGGDFAVCDAGVRRGLREFNPSGQPAVKTHPGKGFVAMSLFHYAAHFAHLAGHMPGADSSSSAGALLEAARSLCAEPHAALLGRLRGGVEYGVSGIQMWERRPAELKQFPLADRVRSRPVRREEAPRTAGSS